METFLLKARRRARSHIEDEPLVSHFADGMARTCTANAVLVLFLFSRIHAMSRPS
jgi:hypothetical protein